MYRIISGKWKAKKILAPKHFNVRPTTDFAKEALFSILDNRMDFPFLSALDLFAGIGSISLELASRECPDVTAIEMNPLHAAFIQSTAQDLDMGLQVQVIRQDVFDFLKKRKNPTSFDLIFADPPFELKEEKYIELIDLILEKDWLTDNGTFVLEHSSRQKLLHPSIFENRKYGNVSFSFIRRPHPNTGSV